MTANTIENREKFYALYWGQRVGMVLNIEGNYQKSWIDTFTFNSIHHLELTPLSDISDEDAIKLLNLDNLNSLEILSWRKMDDSVCASYKWIAKNNNSDGFSYCEYGATFEYLRQNQIDSLRSKSYALPWMDLTIEDLQNYGWVKLR